MLKTAYAHGQEAALTKLAIAWGPIASAAGANALIGALPMALIGGFQGRGGGAGMVAHNALIGGLVGGLPSAMFGAYGEYQNQKAKDQAMKEYLANGGYGSEFYNAPPAR